METLSAIVNNTSTTLGLDAELVPCGMLRNTANEHVLRHCLFVMCSRGYETMVLNEIEELRGDSAVLDMQHKDNSTALHGAAYYGHWKIVEALLQVGCRVDIINTHNEYAIDNALCPSEKVLPNMTLDTYLRSVKSILKAMEPKHLELLVKSNKRDTTVLWRISTTIVRNERFGTHGAIALLEVLCANEIPILLPDKAEAIEALKDNKSPEADKIRQLLEKVKTREV